MKRAPHHLKRRWIFSMGLVALAFYALGCATSPPTPPPTQGAGVDQPSPASQELREIRLVEDQGSLNVVLAGSDALRYTAFKAIDPLRLVVDLPNTEARGVPSPLLVERGVIDKIETAVVTRDPQPLTRVEIGLKQETAYEISAEQDGIRVRFEPEPPLMEAKSTEAELANNPPADNLGHGVQAQQEAPPAAQPAVVPPPTEKELAPATKLIAIQPFTTDQSAEIALVTDGKLPLYNAFPLTNPPRIVVDLMGIKSGLDRESLSLSGPLATKARIGKYKNKVRVVIDLVPAKGIPYEAVPGSDRLLLSLKPGAGFPAQPAGTAPTEPVAAKGALAVIKAIDFNILESGQSRLTVTADTRLEPTVQVTGAKSLSLVLKNAELPKHLRRHIDTGQFASAVNVIDPRLARGAAKTVDIHVELREMVPYNLSPAASQIYLDLDPSAVPPPKPIELGKPVTLTEGRTPSAAETVAEPPTAPVPAPAPGTEVVAASQEEAGEAEAVEEAPPVKPLRPAVKAAPTPGRAEKPLTVSSVHTGYTGEPISLDLQDVDIRNVLRLLADVTGKNLVVESDVKGRVTLKVDRVPWDQVLDLILKINNLDKVLEGNVIRVATADKIRVEREQRLASLEAEQKRLAATKDIGEITTSYIQVNYADSKNIASQIDKMKSDKGTLSVDDRTNLIIYSDYPKRIENARTVIGRLDRATPQVMIESRIVEASTNFSRDLGIQWGGTWYTQHNNRWDLGPISATGNQGLTGTTLTTPPTGFPQPRYVVDAPVSSIGSLGLSLARFSSNNILLLDMKLMALENAGEVKLVSAPRIFTLDNVEAQIQQGEQIPYPQQSQDGISTAFVPATLSLTVTPHITPDDRVRLQVKVKNDFADFGRTVNGTPAINTREAKTELLVNSGDTIVIGGIIKQDKSWSEARVPFLSRIPVLSWLFKSRQVRDDKSELLIFLSPTIMRDGKTSA